MADTKMAADTDVLVLGAGVAGLKAARDLVEAGRRVVVLEARERVGGRVWTDHGFAPHPVELGAEFVHGERADTWALLREVGLDTRPWPKLDESLVRLEDGSLRTMRAARAADPAFDATRTMALGGEPARRYEDLDAFVTRVGWTGDQRRYLRRAFANAVGDDPHHLSAAAIVAGLADDWAGLGDYRLVGGYDALPRALAVDLDVRLGTPVVGVMAGRDGVVVTTAGEHRWRARQAVVTLPLGVLQAGDVVFEPDLADLKGPALAGLRMGPVVKVVYRLTGTPFGRDASPPVEALYAAGSPPMWWTASPPRTERPVWTGFISGSAAADLLRLRPEDALARAFGALLDEHERAGAASGAGGGGESLGYDRARLVAWPDDPWARGGYSHVVPGHHGARAALAAPTPPLYWAGEATASDGAAATVHGAWRSGARAARDVLATA